MKIKIAGLQDGKHSFEFLDKETEVGELTLKNLHADVVISKAIHIFKVDISLDFQTTLNCDRCLTDFTTSFSNEFSVTWSREKEYDEVPDENDEVRYIAPEKMIIDIRQDVEDFAQLAIPMKVLCQLNCEGLCSVCGVNKNIEKCGCSTEKIDPRWEQLLKLKNKNN